MNEVHTSGSGELEGRRWLKETQEVKVDIKDDSLRLSLLHILFTTCDFPTQR